MPSFHNSNSLSERAPAVLEQLRAYHHRHRVLPSVAELAELTGITSKGSMTKILDVLVGQGLLSKLPSGRMKPGVGLLGFELGRPMPAGVPDTGEAAYDERIAIDAYLAPDPSATKLFPINGDSMIGRGLIDGDIAVVAMGKTAKTGDIVLARIDGTETLKVLAHDGAGNYLQPANPAYRPLRPTTELSVLGVVTGTFGRR